MVVPIEAACGEEGVVRCVVWCGGVWCGEEAWCGEEGRGVVEGCGVVRRGVVRRVHGSSLCATSLVHVIC